MTQGETPDKGGYRWFNENPNQAVQIVYRRDEENFDRASAGTTKSKLTLYRRTWLLELFGMNTKKSSVTYRPFSSLMDRLNTKRQDYLLELSMHSMHGLRRMVKLIPFYGGGHYVPRVPGHLKKHIVQSCTCFSRSGQNW